MTRRIGIAQALINDPDFLILDEPTSGLDPIGTRQVKDLIIEMGKRGKTVLLSSHLLADVEDVCDRMVMLYGGKIRAQGTVDELLSDTERTVIYTSRLAPETISKVEKVIEQAEGKCIDRVEVPRQRLEHFFMELVEQARQEEVSTSGVIHGGETADFLRAEDARGDELIETLVSEQQEVARAREVAPAASPPAEEQRDEMLAELLHEQTAELAPAATPPTGPAAVPEVPEDVDAAMIESLLEDKQCKSLPEPSRDEET